MDLDARRLLHSQRLLPACDSCYVKKTRCDRLNPCTSCIVNSLDCLRRRQRTSTRKRNRLQSNRVDDIASRLMRLEETLRTTGQQSLPTTSSHLGASGSPDPVSQADSPNFVFEQLSSVLSRECRNKPGDHGSKPEASTRPALALAKKQFTDLNSSHGEYSLSPECEEIASIDLQRYLRSCPQHNLIDTDRRKALESTIDSAKELAISGLNSDQEHSDPHPESNFYDPSLYPSAELLHLMLSGASRNLSTTYFLDFYTNVSSQELERMTFALNRCTVHGQRRLQYIICVNYLAFAYLTTLESDQSQAMREHLLALKRKHKENVQSALNQLDVRVRPERPLLQALLSGAMLMQASGETRRCWQLNNAACRISMALSAESYLQDMEVSLPPEEYFQLKFSFMKCHIFDVALSASLYQTAADMTGINFNTDLLDMGRPSHAMISVLLKCTEAQESMVRETRAFNELGYLKNINLERWNHLKSLMMQIRDLMDEMRLQVPSCDDDYISYEWRCMDFWFHSMMTSVIRLSGTHGDPKVHTESLQHARNALSVLRQLLDRASRPSPASDKYVICLTWFVPLFPLQPLYILFSNVISTSDTSDLKLMQELGKRLENLAKTHPSILVVRRICKSLLELHRNFTEKIAGSTGSFESAILPLEAVFDSSQQEISVGNAPPRDGRRKPRPKPSPMFAIDPMSDSFQNSYTSAQIEPIPDTSTYTRDFDWESFCAQESFPVMDYNFPP